MDTEATSDTGPISGDNGQHSKKGSEMATNEMPLVPWEHELCEAVAARCFDTVVSILGEPNRAFAQKVLDDCLLDACGLYKNSDQYLLIELLRSGASIKAVSEDGWTPVLIAVKNVDMNLLSFLLQKGADVNAVTAEGDSALTLSVRPNRSLDIIKLLLQLEEIDNNHRNHQGYTALMKAVELRDFEVMKLLIDDHKCNNRETLAVSEDNVDSDETIINCFGQELYDVARTAGMVKVIKLLLHLKQGDSPLLEAALRADVELVKILIDSQFCSIQKEDSSHTTFLQTFFQIKKQRNLAVGDVDIPIIKLLLENGAAVNKSEKSWSSIEPPLITAVEVGSLGLVQLMCKYGAKLDVTENDSSKTPLLVAAVSGKADILQFLLSKHAMVAGQGREVTYKYSVLHLSLVNGHTNCAEILLNHGYKIDGPSAAEYAIAYNKPAYLKYLLEKFSPGVQNSLLSNSQKYNTILTKAVTNDYVNIINTLAEGDVHIPDFLLSHAKSASMVQLLVSNGASVNRRETTTGNPFLLTFIRSSKNKTFVAQRVKIFLENGANVNDCNLYGVTPLIAAAQTWDSSELLNTLLLHGADVHKRDNQGMTAFMYAVEKNFTENAKLLIQLGGDQKVDFEWRNTSGSTPLLIAATYNNKTITDSLLDRGADVNVHDQFGDTALTLVTRNGDADTLKKIIERGADIDHQNKSGYSALMYAAERYTDVSNLDVLLLHGAKVNIKDSSGNTPLLHAVQQDRAEITKCLLEHEGNQKVDLDAQDTSCSTSLILAVKKRNKAITDLLLARGANVNIEDNSGDTALTLVVRNGDTDTIKKIIERGADVNIKDNRGNTALLLALEQSLTETAKLLIEHEGGQKVDLDAQNTSGSTALLSAIKQRFKPIADLLIDRGANVNAEDNNGDTALTLAAKDGDTDTLEKILERGADVNHRNKEGYTALMLVARNSYSYRNLSHLKVLLLKGADMNIKDNMGNTALLLALECWSRSTETAKLLIEHEGDQKVDLDAQNTSGSTALLSAIKQRFKPIADLLIDRGANVNAEDNNGDTALTLAAKDGDTDTLEKILERGADVNHRNKEGYTALMLLARNLYSYRNLSHLKVLLLKGADMNIKDNMGNTALLLALECCRSTETAKLFIEHEGDQKVDLDAQNTSGSTALLSAIKQRFKPIADLLIDRGANVNAEDNNGDTALTLAAKDGDTDTLEKILERGADVNHRNKEGYTALMLLARNLYSYRNLSHLKVLLLKGADMNIKDNMGNTALLYCRSTETAKLLIEHEGDQKVDLDAQNTSGSTALISAVKQKHRTIADLLIDRGANVNVEDNNGDTALTLLTRANDCGTLKKIIERGADINHQNKQGYSALMNAALNLNKDCMEALLNAGADVNVVSHGQEKKTAISLLCETKSSYNKFNNYLLMDSLLDKGARSSYLNPRVFFDLIQSKELRLISKLISSGFGPVELCSEKYLHDSDERVFFPVVSPFMFALLYSHSKLARYLDGNWFLSSSDIQLQAKRGLAKEVLERRSNDECVDILDEFCSQPLSLLKLSFVAVSSAIGCVPGREERVDKLPLPPIIKDKLLFKKQEVQLDP